jgi:hypothetical protein
VGSIHFLDVVTGSLSKEIPSIAVSWSSKAFDVKKKDKEDKSPCTLLGRVGSTKNGEN